jgi:deoxyribose-phosphate aldolase
MKAIEYPQEAEEGQGELKMPYANSNLVQKQLSELTQQVVHIVQACNEEKEILEDEFESVKANIEILESRIYTNKQRVDMEVAGVGSQMQLQEAVL